MLASELVADLTTLIKEHGDQPIYLQRSPGQQRKQDWPEEFVDSVEADIVEYVIRYDATYFELSKQ